MHHNYVYLNNSHDGIAVSPEIYDQVLSLVKANCVCGKCEQTYTQDNPQVVRNFCKKCFLRHTEYSYNLRYIGLLKQEPGGKAYYRFIGEKDVYVTHSDQDMSRFSTYNKSPRETLKYWGFPEIPESYEYNGETIPLFDSCIHIYSNDVRKDTVVMIEYRETYRPSIIIPFLVYRGGSVKAFDKRRGEGRKLWIEAKKRAEACKGTDGYYHIFGYTHHKITDYDMCRMVAHIVSESYVVPE